MRIKPLIFVAAFLASPFSWATNTFNTKCPASAKVGTIGTPPTGWSNGPGLTVSNVGAYMAQPTLKGCTYAQGSMASGSLSHTLSPGVTCTVAGDNQTFNCSNSTTVTCPSLALIGYVTPFPTGWAGSGTGNSAGYGAVFQNRVTRGGTVLTCDYNQYAGVLFQSSPAGSTCTTGADSKSHDCTTPFVASSAPVTAILPVLDSPSWSWLSSKIVFTNGNGTTYPYGSWSSTDRNRLESLYQSMLNSTPLNVNCPNIATQIVLGGNLYSSRAQALDVYLAQVAHMFYIEATQKVPWSFLGFSDVMLNDMLGSKSLFSTIQPSSNSSSNYPIGVVVQQDFQSPFRTEAEAAPSIVCNPDIGYRLMAGLSTTQHQNLIGPDRETTLKNLSVWFAENVGHGGLPANPATAAKLEDRLVIHDSSGKGVVESDGCHGGSNLIFDIARSVNLPIVPGSMVSQSLSYPVPPTFNSTFEQFTHGSLVFAWGEPGERVVQHMDDINAMGNRTWGPIDGSGNLLSYAQAKQVFFDAVWRTPADMTARGYPYQSSLPWVIPGSGWGLYQRTGGFEDRPDFGRLVGVWNADGSDEGAYSNAFYADQGYSLCRWQLYLDAYCQAPVGTSSAWISTVTPPSSGPFHTVAEHTTHAAACIQAIGGCAAAQAAATNFYNNVWGTDIVVSP